MNRRAFLSLTAATAISSTAATGAEQCPAPGFPAKSCSAMLDFEKFTRLSVAAEQEETQWCWAACMQMVSTWYGFATSQRRIVEEIYGGIVNMGADDLTLTSALNRKWKSNDGRHFDIKADVFSAGLGLANVDNTTIVRNLAADRPLIVGIKRHAVMLARVDYWKHPPLPPAIQQAHVIDPYPGAAMPPTLARFLTPFEMISVQAGGELRYIASISIEKSNQ